MKSCAQATEDLAVKKDELHRALFTATHCQLVFMALQPKEEVGADNPRARPVSSSGGGERRGSS